MQYNQEGSPYYVQAEMILAYYEKVGLVSSPCESKASLFHRTHHIRAVRFS